MVHGAPHNFGINPISQRLLYSPATQPCHYVVVCPGVRVVRSKRSIHPFPKVSESHIRQCATLPTAAITAAVPMAKECGRDDAFTGGIEFMLGRQRNGYQLR